MKPLTFLAVIVMTISFTTGCFASNSSYQTDAFKTKSGKTVTITAIKHASLRIQYDGLEIQVDPVAQYEPQTDYSAFPKADVILVTHEHFDHFDSSAIAALTKNGTQIIVETRFRHSAQKRRKPQDCQRHPA